MSKLKNALFGLNVRGTIGRALSFRKSGSRTIAEKKPIPTDAKSLAQLSWRHMYQKAVALWHALSIEEQGDWESQARRRHMTGFAWFMSQCLKPNPGIYLPLQGGTMSGDIDMSTHRILDLPLPDDVKEPVRKKDLSAHAAKNTIIHGVGADYVAKAEGSQYIAVKRAGDNKLGQYFRRAVNDSDFMLEADSLGWKHCIDQLGKDHPTLAGILIINVPDAAKTGYRGLSYTGCTDNPQLHPNTDDQQDCGTNAKRWRLVRGVTVTQGEIGFEERQCHLCHQDFKIGNCFALVITRIEPDKEIEIIEVGDPNEKTPRKVKVKNHGYMAAVPVCRGCFLKTTP